MAYDPKFNLSQQQPNRVPQPHIKKPLNAFMLYMRDVRPEVLKQVPHKDSTTINQMIGKMWQALSKPEQALYFEKARQERERHKIMYPEYNPRDYYAQNLKKRRRKRDKNGNEPLPKKCRARYGVDQQEKWCKHCKRKKKCLRYIEATNEGDSLIGDSIHHIPNSDVCMGTPIPNLICNEEI
ncbi:hypothetical protein MXB_2681 [Myxobolus squamalis]|nr:hypothetical protein MXB_2681 [Myxobolus squamalis]